MKIRRKLDEFGLLLSDELDLKFYGGGKGGGGSHTTEKIYMPAPAALAPAVSTPTPAPAPVQEAATQDTAATPEEEEAKKLKEANKAGAKSLQIPLTGSTTAVSDATKAVGTV